MDLKSKFFYLILLFPVFSYGVVGMVPLDSAYTSDVTIDENYTLSPSDSNPANFTGFLFQGYDILNISPDATVTVNVATSGNYTGYSGAIFRGQNGKTYTINGGNIVLNVNQVGGSIEGLIMTQARYYGKNANFDINANFSLKATPDVYIQRGVFTSNGENGGYFKFTKNVFIDVSEMQPSKGWGSAGNGKGYRMIFSLEGSGNVYVNYNDITGQTLDRNNIIQLKGDLSAENTSKGNININLDNSKSFFQGRISITPGSMSNIQLYLNHGGKWILNANSQITTLDSNNESYVVNNQYNNLDKLAVVDFTQIADDGLSKRLTSSTIFSPRTLSVQTINGQNGVFRLMGDLELGKIDNIQAGSVNGLEYIQIYQNPSKILLDASGKNMVVASASSLADGADFKGIATIIGLYDYVPHLDRVSDATGTKWILGSIERSPNQTAKSLLNLLSLPYQIFRIEGDSAHTRMDDMTYPPTLNGLWMKIYGGGIYAKQLYGEKTTQDLFYNIQGGYDKGEVYGDERYFYGGSLDYTKLSTSDTGINGHVNSIAFGGYGGYVNAIGWVLDGTFKYVYSNIKANLSQAPEPFNFGNHILLVSARVGYNFYPFYGTRTKTIEKCTEKIFCRNAITSVKIRDESLYFQPYFSFTPALIFGNTIKFEDKQSHSNINAKLDSSPALITKIGLLGVKRYDYMYSALNLRALVEYSNDINLGGKVTLVDDINIPLYNNAKKIDNRLGLGMGVDWLFFNDSLKLHTDFKTEFFGQINTYWLLSAGIRYKFGQKAPRTYKSQNLRPTQNGERKKSSKNIFKPYNERKLPQNNTYKQNNHFKTYGNENKIYQQNLRPTQQENVQKRVFRVMPENQRPLPNENRGIRR
ncbi:autotransporter domain-containing protein [Helicobacter cappadocius]|uniref:Autotransporter domain-containing protein n=1 Tax=Helicobacter cappadocius TaxID=3063998 RepID=A0AA90PX91_9HELI|nr:MULTISPECIES: autotransporter domain-containing protein [unclassified Helicobacter]MDO7252396.1 autotransporter domain-containing protein [Helicobacter sp. faydin-H75]MDP2538263.1 autotransporter domain-containing protein [Helicobacter sp. faydin-H76]